MNGKQAKRLRRAALGLATTLTEAGREVKRDGYMVKMHENRFSPSSLAADADVPALESTKSYQLLVRKDSLKGIYKTLKTGKI